MRSSVDLPQPDGPDQDDELAVADVDVDAVNHLDRAEGLADLADRDRGHSCLA